MAQEVSKITRALYPYDDGSGARYRVTVTRSRNGDGEDEVVLVIAGPDGDVQIDANDWDAVKAAAESAVTFICDAAT